MTGKWMISKFILKIEEKEYCKKRDTKRSEVFCPTLAQKTGDGKCIGNFPMLFGGKSEIQKAKNFGDTNRGWYDKHCMKCSLNSRSGLVVNDTFIIPKGFGKGENELPRSRKEEA